MSQYKTIYNELSPLSDIMKRIFKMTKKKYRYDCLIEGNHVIELNNIIWYMAGSISVIHMTADV